MNSPTPVAPGRVFRPIAMVHPRGTRRLPARGFTLIEMLVALAITLIMMGAVVTLFGVISQSVSGSRAAIEMSDRLRAARNQLQLDLQGATATMKPPLRPENDEGYLEIIEGQYSDWRNGIDNPGIATDDHLKLFGDTDDVLMLTVHSRGAPFTGKWFDGTNVRMIESPVAEVIYFLAQDPLSLPPIVDATTNPPTRLYTLYRRVLLVAPALEPNWPSGTTDFCSRNDWSVRFEGGVYLANTLGDLTKRENRFAHYGTTVPPAVNYDVFPFPVDLTMIPQVSPSTPPAPPKPVNWPPGRPTENAFLAPFTDPRTGDDVLLNNVLAFDVQVFDIKAPMRMTGGVALEPHDPGWAVPTTDIGFGAYVDLGFAPLLSPASLFSGTPPAKSGLAMRPFVYDTWSLHYENDGVDQNTIAPVGADLGTNGLDDAPTNGIVDDIDEYDTLPPYSAPLRGLRVKIRVYEPSSQVVREAIVIQSFLPE